MGNVNSIQTPQSYSFFDSNKPYLVSAILISASVALFIKGFTWRNYNHIGCGALIGAGGISAISGLLLICLKSCCSDKTQSEPTQLSDDFYIKCTAAMRKDLLPSIRLLELRDKGIETSHPIINNYVVDLVIYNSLHARSMLELGLINPNLPDSEGRLILHEAVKAKRLHLVEVLLDHGADKSKKDQSGKTALDYVSNEEIRHLMLHWKRADALLHQAIEKNNREQLLKALDNGADIHSVRSNETPLAAAISKKRFQLIKDLLERGASIDKMGSSSVTVLDTIMLSGALEDEDLKHFCDATHKEFSNEQKEALMIQYYDELLQLFRDKGFELEKMDKAGCTRLYLSLLMRAMNPFFARYLIRCGDVTNSETSPAFAAAIIIYLENSVPNSTEYNEALNILDTLLRNNVDVCKKFTPGKTHENLLQFAKSKNYDREDLNRIVIEIAKKGLKQLVSGACPQDEEQKQLQQINLSESLDILSSKNVVEENKAFLKEIYNLAVEKEYLHLIPQLATFKVS